MPSGTEGVWYLSRLPWLGASIAVALAVSIVASGRLARWLSVPRVTAGVLILSVGMILSGTLTPLGAEFRPEPPSARSCDFSRIGLAGMSELSFPSNALFNVMMFIPLGFAIGLAPRSSRWLLVLAAALGLPLLIEATQSLVPPLGRSCESADVADNVTGLLLGLALGMLAARFARSRSRPGAKGP